MSARRKYRLALIAVFCVGVMFLGFFANYTLDTCIPNEISVVEGEELALPDAFFMNYRPKESGVETSKTGTEILEKEKEYQISADILGLFHYKDIKVNVLANEKIIPCGTHVGIYLQTNGVLIIGTSTVKGIDGNQYSPAGNIVKADDYIISFNEIKVNSKSQLIFLIEKYGGEDVKLGIRRKQETLTVKLTPVETSAGKYQLGIWVRDDMQGIGTMTYVKENGEFGALGHGISDVDTGELLSSENGILYNADIWGIEKGKSGSPGGLLGSIEYEDTNMIGTISENCSCGIYGILEPSVVKHMKQNAMPIGLKQNIKKGPATILCALQEKGGKVEEYKIAIEQVDITSKNENKGMVIKITDERLLKQTNGIVQGMSGSPILQNGKVVGAVTHVLVKDPAKGYGIFIENMLEHN